MLELSVTVEFPIMFNDQRVQFSKTDLDKIRKNLDLKGISGLNKSIVPRDTRI
jgi:hypothetical protein